MRKNHTKKKLLSLLLAAVFSVSALVPAAQADAAEIQPLPFNTYINGNLVTINNSLLFEGHTYVQLRELAKVSNMSVEFVDPANPGMSVGYMPPRGINIGQPTYVYVNKNVADWSSGTLVVHDKAVDITGVFGQFVDATGEKGYDYYFADGALHVPDGNGGEKVLELNTFFSDNGRLCVTVDDYRNILQPYMLDLCMQEVK